MPEDGNIRLLVILSLLHDECTTGICQTGSGWSQLRHRLKLEIMLKIQFFPENW